MYKRNLLLLSLVIISFCRGLCSPVLAISRTDQTLTLTLQEAVLMALENNESLRFERQTPAIAAERLKEQEAVFDPNLVVESQISAENAQRLLGASTEFLDIFSTAQDYSLGLEKTFATGSQLSLSVATNAINRSLANGSSNQQVSRLGLSFTQALLQGRDPAVNTALIREAELETQLVSHNLRGFAEALVASTENAFWDYLLAGQQLKMRELALQLTQQELKNTRERIAVGRVAGIEEVTLQTEVGLRQQEVITARGNQRQRELELLRLLNPSSEQHNWSDYTLRLTEPVAVPEVQLDVLPQHIRLALQQRPELKEAQTLAEQRKLTVVRTRDGLLPVLDVFLLLGKTGYAESFLGSIGNLTGNGFDFATGFRFAYPLGARAEEARYATAQLQAEQQTAAIENLKQQIALDLHRGYLQITLAREQIAAVKSTRILQQTRFNAEQERYRVGRTSAFQLVLVQRDLLNAQIQEAEALINYLKALTNFYRFEGTLLKRHGITSIQ